MMATASYIICAAIIVEGIIAYVKTFFVNGKFQWQMITSLVLGIVVALAYSLDLLVLCGLESNIPLIGQVLTGILLSRGANYIADLIKLLISASDNMKNSANVLVGEPAEETVENKPTEIADE
jgi:hypothetical protein